MDRSVALAIKITADAKNATAGMDATKSKLDGVTGAASSAAAVSGQAARALGGISKGLSLIGADKAAADLKEAGQALQFVKGAANSVKLATSAYTAVTESSTAATVAKTIVEKASAAGTSVMTAAQWALNAALDANPVALIVIGIIALIAVIVLAYKHSETFRNIVQGAFKAVSAAAGATVDFIKKHWELLLAILLGPFAVAALEIYKHWDDIKAGAAAVIDWVRGKWPAVEAILTGPFTTARDTVNKVWDAITGGFTDARTALSKTAALVQSDVSGAFDAIGSAIQAVLDKIQSAIDKLASLAGKAKGIGTLGGLLGRTAAGSDLSGLDVSRGAGIRDVHVHINGGFVGNEVQLIRKIRDGLAQDQRRLRGLTA